MRLLAIESSNQTLSVAVVEDGRLVAELTTHTKTTHGERLMPAIETVIANTPYTIKDMDRIAVSQGPGSYTGLRIGVTTAKTFAWTLDKELVGVSSLEVLAANISGNDRYIVPLFDARRQNVYTGLYQREGDQLKNVEADTHLAMDEWLDYLATLEGEFVFVGTDVKAFEETISEKLTGRYLIAEEKEHLPRASVLGRLAESKEPTGAHTFEPTYLKLAEAEENWLKDHPEAEDESYVEKI